jgi:hypothetical protein
MAKRWMSLGCAAWVAAAGGLLIGLGSGCGGDYSEKVQTWTHNTPSGGSGPAAFDLLYAAEDLKGTNPTLQFGRPQVFTAGAMENGQGDDRRAKPPCIDVFPGLKLTCEAFKELPDKPGQQAAYYFYIGSTTAAAGAKDSALNAFKTKLGAQAQKLSLDDWVAFPSGAGPAGAKIWQKLRYTGSQNFCVKDRDGKETFSAMPGVFTVYVLEESGQVVIVAFRAPLSLEQPAGLDQMALAVTANVAKK